MNDWRPLRVLVLAEACNPTWTSVPLVGFNWAHALARHPELDVTLVTQVRNRPALLDHPLAQEIPIHFIDTETVSGPMYWLAQKARGGRTLGWTTNTALAWPGYLAFERGVARLFKSQLNHRTFDLVHRVTPVSPTLPSPLAGWSATPMVLGPLNGGLPWPKKQFPDLARAEKEWLVPVRKLYRQLPYFRTTYRRAAGVIAGSKHTLSELPPLAQGQTFYLPENGIDPEKFPLADHAPPPPGPGDPLRLIFVGRLVPYKGADLVLDALSKLTTHRPWKLDIIGEGPEKEPLQQLVKKHQLENRVEIHGWLPQEVLADQLRQSHVFVFPSLREFGGGVVLEAMSAGLACVIVDYGGPSELITPQTGLAVPLNPREKLVPDLQHVLHDLIENPRQAHALGSAACLDVQKNYTWSAKADKVVSIYRDILASRPRVLSRSHRR